MTTRDLRNVIEYAGLNARPKETFYNLFCGDEDTPGVDDAWEIENMWQLSILNQHFNPLDRIRLQLVGATERKLKAYDLTR